MITSPVKKSVQPSAPFTPSKYQSAIFDVVLNGGENLAIEAVAGSGKSRTLVELSKLIPKTSEVLFCAFNKHIAEELARKLPKSVTVKTIHALGFASVAKHLGKAKVNAYKYSDLVSDKAFSTINQHPYDCGQVGDLTSILADMVRFSQSTLTDVQNASEMSAMCSHYGVDVQDWDFILLCDSVSEILKAGERIAIERKEVDFIDMIWLPIFWDLTFPSYDFVLVDEAQDLSKCQLEVVLKCCHKTSRVIAVGDRSQSIYGFSGSDNNSFENIVNRLKAKCLPLSICYRCPKSHLDLAREIVSQIEASPTAKPGMIQRCYDFALVEHVRPGDFVLSRTTAPLITQCIRMIGSRVPAKVIGRDISKSLTKMVKDVAKQKGFKFAEFPQHLQTFVQAKADKLSKKKNAQSEIEKLLDKREGLLAAYDGFEGITSVEDFCKEIDNLFSDAKASVTLCTVHRAKGLEGDRVFILNPDKMPLVWKGQKGWEFEQEMNLKYVALTRSKDFLCFVYPPDK